MSELIKKTTTPFVLIIVIFFAIRWGGDAFWRQISPYFAYAFEAAFIVFSYRYLQLKPILTVPPKDFLILIAGGLLGYLVHEFAIVWGIPVPFDFDSLETLILLLVVAPVLEELLFHGALWELLKKFLVHSPFRNQTNLFLILKTSAWFSIGHFLAYFFVPPSFQSFVLYQTGYTFLLGAFLGFRLTRGGSMGVVILGHFGFNLGFYLFTILKG